MSKIDALQFVPIILAVVGIIMSGFKINKVRRRSDLIISVISIIGAMLLIFAQTSWWEAAIIQGKLEDTWFANQIWLIFNTIMMILVILVNKTRG